MPDDLRVNGWLVIPGTELHERFSRSSGPGGQSVNTADSRVELSYDVERSAVLPGWARARITERLAGRLAGGVLTVAASEQRSQLANRQGARARLAALLRDAVAPPHRPRDVLDDIYLHTSTPNKMGSLNASVKGHTI